MELEAITAATHPLNDPDKIFLEAQRFHKFVYEIILPFEPVQFRAHSKFHRSLMYTACQPLSTTAAPRGFLKSTIFSRYRPLHRLVDPLIEGSAHNVDYLLISETDELSASHLDWIKHHLENNPHLIRRYGKLKPDEARRKPWNKQHIVLTNGNKCSALGYGSQIRSRHPTDVTVDDLESHKNMDTPEKLQQLKNWFYRVLMGAMIPETRMTVIGTIIEKQSLLSELLASSFFNGRLWKALNEDENGAHYSLWPEQWPVSMLLYRRELLGLHQFEAEYQNNPRGMQDPIILPEWISMYQEESIAHVKPVARYIACDPAFTEERWGDFSAVVVLDEMANGTLYERLAWRKKITGPELIRTLMSFWYHFSQDVPVCRFGIEEVAAQKTLRQSINELDTNIPVIPLKPDKDKVRRLVDVSRYIEAGTVRFKTASLTEEVLNFPKGSKDRVDSLVYCLKLYEQDHPTLLTGEVMPIDNCKNLTDIQLEHHLTRMLNGDPFYGEKGIPNKYIQAYEEAQFLSSIFG